MNNPQTKNGYIMLATGDPENDVVMALISAGLSAVEWQVIMLILRKTYGHKKKEDWISLSQFVQQTRRSKQGIVDAITRMEGMGLITARRDDPQRTFYAFNKSFHTWRVVNPSVLVKPSRLVNFSRTASQLSPKHQSTPPDTQKKVTKENTKETPTVTEKIFIFSPSTLMPDFVVVPDELENQQDKPKKKPQPFNWQDYSELTRLMKKTCEFTTLTNGTTAKDNYARHILMFLLKVLVKEHQWPEQEAIDQIRANMEEFCQLVQTAREADKWLGQKVTSLQEIYFELKRGRIFEAAKSKKSNPFTTVRI